MPELRITIPILKVLHALLRLAETEHLYGLELIDRTGLKSGTLYPVLARLEEAGWVTSTWEHADPHKAGRPRRRYYQLTALGQRTGSAALGEFSQLALPTERSRRRLFARPVWEQS